MQYFWIVVSVALMVFAGSRISSDNIPRSLVLIVIAVSLLIDAITILSYFRNKAVFEKLVNAKIVANVVCAVGIVILIAISTKLKQ